MNMRYLAITLLLLTASPSIVLAGEGHDAGYAWAEENDIDDASACSTPSASFNNGCEEYVDENQPAVNEDDEDDDE
jgi:hypothetical protein